MNSPAIDVRHLCKRFHGRKVVDDVSFTVERGEIYGFLGPNGSGKTTSIRLMCGLLTPDSGSGTSLDFDILWESACIKRRVGYMTPRFSLWEDLTIREKLEFVARLYEMEGRREAVDRAIENLGLQGWPASGGFALRGMETVACLGGLHAAPAGTAPAGRADCRS